VAQTRNKSKLTLNPERYECFQACPEAENLGSQLSYANGDKSLVLEPLKGQIDPDASSFTVGKVKIEVKLVKRAAMRWGSLVGDAPDRKHLTILDLFLSLRRARSTLHIYSFTQYILSQAQEELGGNNN
jgi:hypothetical protein